MGKLNKRTKIILNVLIFLLIAVVSGFLLRTLVSWIPSLMKNEEWEINWGILLEFRTYLYRRSHGRSSYLVTFRKQPGLLPL